MTKLVRVTACALVSILLMGGAPSGNESSTHVQSANAPTAVWQQLTSPEQTGWSADGLEKVHNYIEEIGSTSAMIVQQGVIVAACGVVWWRFKRSGWL